MEGAVELLSPGSDFKYSILVEGKKGLTSSAI
jgi:hypothetical protein